MSATLDENKAPRLTVDLTQVLAEMPSRLARVEVHVETMRADIAELKAEAKGLRADFKGDFKEARVELAVLRGHFFWLVAIMVTGFLSLGGLILHGH